MHYVKSVHTLYTSVQFVNLHIFTQTSANTFRSQIATLQAALKGAMEENAARKVQESKLTSQLEVRSLSLAVYCCEMIICSCFFISTIY